jgi:SET domain-containing protein
VEVRESSIEGRGLFATVRIRRGEVVSRLGGRLVITHELYRLLEHSDHYVDSITVGEDVHLVLPHRRMNGYGNHSCDPNLWWDGFYELSARRDIHAGEELTSDYAASTTEETWSMRCTCGASSCRGTVRGSDYRTTDLVERYEYHVVPALRAASSGC